MIYGYARVSTKGQAKDGNSLEAQEKLLREKGATKIFSDSFTGTKMERPAFDELNKVVKAGDTIIVTKLDRIARTSTQGYEQVVEWFDNDITVNILNMGVADKTPTGKLMLHIMFAFAEFERDMIVQRTQEGKAIARENNPDFREGRPCKYGKAQKQHALDLLNSGKTYREVEEVTGITKSTLIRYKRTVEASKILDTK